MSTKIAKQQQQLEIKFFESKVKKKVILFFLSYSSKKPASSVPVLPNVNQTSNGFINRPLSVENKAASNGTLNLIGKDNSKLISHSQFNIDPKKNKNTEKILVIFLL